MNRWRFGIAVFAALGLLLYIPARWLEIQYQSGTWWSEHPFVTLGSMLSILFIGLPICAYVADRVVSNPSTATVSFEEGGPE